MSSLKFSDELVLMVCTPVHVHAALVDTLSLFRLAEFVFVMILLNSLFRSEAVSVSLATNVFTLVYVLIFISLVGFHLLLTNSSTI